MLKTNLYKSKNIKNNKGDVIKLINKSSKSFKGFGELYISKIKKNKIKAWKCHKKMTSNLFIISGKIEIISVIKFKDSYKFEKHILSSRGFNHTVIPPNTIFGFKCISLKESILLNFANIKHNTNEAINYPLNFFDYKWN